MKINKNLQKKNRKKYNNLNSTHIICCVYLEPFSGINCEKNEENT